MLLSLSDESSFEIECFYYDDTRYLSIEDSNYHHIELPTNDIDIFIEALRQESEID